MTDYTQLIERLRSEPIHSSVTVQMNVVAKKTIAAIEALQARVKELEQERDEADRRAGFAERKQAADSDALTKMRLAQDNRKVQLGYDTRISFDVVFDVLVAQRDTALAKLAAAESGQDHNAGEVVGFTDEYVLVEFPCEGNTVDIEMGMLLYPHPVIAASAQSQSLSDEDIVEIGNEVHRAMPNDADEQEELVAIVREVESRHGIGGGV